MPSQRSPDELLRRFSVAAPLAALAAFVGCRLDMHDQPRYEPYEESDFFLDGRSARQPVVGTVARGDLPRDEGFLTGRTGGEYVANVPLPADRQLLARGRERYEIYCTPCHDYVGTGRGMIVQRGFQAPPSFHNDPLRRLPDGYIFEVITEGVGAMYDYSASVEPRDRWAIVAYIRALQLSQFAPIAYVSAEVRARIEGGER